MPQSIPKAAVLLEAAIKYLETELMPTLDGYHRFQTRVTVNVLNTVRRELELRGAQAEAERSRLVAILGHDGDAETLSIELAKRIRAGAIAIDDPALRAHVRQSLADALAINNPKWLTR
jgi:ABC-type transport system involved in Fe-S cluster assembly fused permease/ATPase subunit